MIVKKYSTEIISIQNPAEGVYTLDLASPKSFKYNPGNFLHLALDEYDPSGAWPESRCFSIQTSPEEKNIKITYAVKGDFTKRMEKELCIGNKIWLKLPYGDLFTQEHNKNNTIFIAGGTGITPYLSLFTDKSFALYENPSLYIGFRNRSLFLYQQELDKAVKINPGLNINYYFQDVNGIINIENIYNFHTDSGTYFLSGPPSMIKNFKLYLLSKNIDNSRIKTDDWE